MDETIRERSGLVNDSDKLVTFIYLLGRDHLPVGEIEEIMKGISKDEFVFSNGWLAKYAQDVKNRLRRK